MNLIFFTHPAFLSSQSMPRFSSMLTEGMKKRGHTVAVWTPKAFFYKLPVPHVLKKWLGYLDQYFLFPQQIRRILNKTQPDTLFVFTDHALGPWVPLVKDRPHAIHCHDFLAQRSAMGKIVENPTSWSGRLYQSYIRKGYRKGKNFISVSHQTEKDLRTFLLRPPLISEVVYNGMNKNLETIEAVVARAKLEDRTDYDLSAGYILHVGGNQWYKNRKGVIDIYTAWRTITNYNLPLLLVGSAPIKELEKAKASSRFAGSIHFLSGKDDEFIQLAYSGATVFLYPSLDEGFGWPIAEAMTAGCPVITTNKAPMTEVGGAAAFYIDRMPRDESLKEIWLDKAVKVLEHIVSMDYPEREVIINTGLINVKRFDADEALQKIETIYNNIVITD